MIDDLKFPKGEDKMGWRDLMDQLEQKLEEGQEKQQTLNDAIAAANDAQADYTKVVAEIEALKTKVQETVGSVFSAQNLKVRQF